MTFLDWFIEPFKKAHANEKARRERQLGYGREYRARQSQPATAPAGWYADPEKPGNERWWDGAQWTEQTRWAPPQVPGTSSPASVAARPQAVGETIRQVPIVQTGVKLGAIGCVGYLTYSLIAAVVFIGGCAVIINAGSHSTSNSSKNQADQKATRQGQGAQTDAASMTVLATAAGKHVQRQFHIGHVSTTCKFVKYEQIDFAPDDWLYRCSTSAVTAAGDVHHFREDLECYEPPPYAREDCGTGGPKRVP